jgi:hypothetical protein
MRRTIRATLAGALLACLLPATTGYAKVLARWVELGSNGSSSVRAITDDACPSVLFDGMPTPMSTRSDPGATLANVTAAAFAVRGCEIAVPAGAISAVLDGKALPLARPNPQRIVVLGDTGCRLKGAAVQDCNDPQSWPFPVIAAAAAAARPDLVIHVGDYHYRESACPVARSGCNGSPSGYGWDAWNADFFVPAAPLFDAGPWVMLRGNHEDCDRAGEGWFRFLDRMPMPAACSDLSGIFVARLGDFAVVAVDGAKAEDPKDDAAPLAAMLRQQLVDVLPQLPAEAWLASHRPFDAVRAPDKHEQGNVVDNHVQELAFGAIMPAAVSVLLSGHIHFFQAIDFGGERPPQLVVGTGGDALALMPPLSLAGADINGVPVKTSVTYSGFGYMVWDRAPNGWAGTLFDTAGKPLQRCSLAKRSLTCGG